MHENINITKYIVKFGLSYFFIILLLSIISILLNLNSSSSSAVSIIAAAMIASLKFIKDNKRIPNAYEKKRLVWYSFATAWFVSLLVITVFLSIVGKFTEAITLLRGIKFIPLFMIILFTSALNILILYFSYGWLANKQYEGLVKKGKI